MRRHTLLVDPDVALGGTVDLLNVGASVSNDAAHDLGRNFGRLFDEARLAVGTGAPNLLRGMVEIALVRKEAALGTIATGAVGLRGRRIGRGRGRHLRQVFDDLNLGSRRGSRLRRLLLLRYQRLSLRRGLPSLDLGKFPIGWTRLRLTSRRQKLFRGRRVAPGSFTHIAAVAASKRSGVEEGTGAARPFTRPGNGRS